MAVPPDQTCIVVDDVLIDPAAVVDWATEREWLPAQANAYPGQLVAAPAELEQCLNGFFSQHVRRVLGGRRMVSMYARFSMVTRPVSQLRPCQWLCHRDRVVLEPRTGLCAASVLYLFDDPSLGGTGFYRPKLAAEPLAALLDDAQRLSNLEFEQRYGVRPGYMIRSNDYFELVAHVPAAWNRMIFYDGGQFHSGHIERLQPLSTDVREGRLTLNGFFACSRASA